jgi:acyl-CoA reductase-like NAD-dependent aldehyde dehydrogenase
LGGKVAAVVLDDADLDSAADKIAFSGLMHAGQICMSTVLPSESPIYLVRSGVICSDKIGSVLVAKPVERMKKFSAGDEGRS